MEWTTVDRPGYFGKKRDELFTLWNNIYRSNNWRIAYQWGNLVIPKEIGIQIYEDAYVDYLKKDPSTLDWLISTASDVYDTSPSNVHALFDYEIQETPNNHIHDVAIRKAVLRLGKEFKGKHLVEVRWKESEGFRLCPGIVPFHMPEMICKGEIKNYNNEPFWWNEKSIEDFYQRNKILQVKK